MDKPANIDAYLSSVPEDRRAALEKLRAQIHESIQSSELLITTDQRQRSRWLSIAAGAVLIVGVVGSLMWLDRNRPTPSASPSTSAPPASAPSSTTVVTRGDTVPYGPLDYATTEQELPMWPLANVSDPPATTTGYGMALCDSGYGTKILRVDSPTDTPSTYSGTLCVFIDLARPKADAVVSCSTLDGQSPPSRQMVPCSR
mgnify:CR=1 FL=1